ncbi:MvdC/MvdD family ATP grasp protein [Paenibacillus macerans]|uniref:MvdC/MvdD family ATP grasp protein n=1 Tax=Paenibacillus macerans TaxID=44252 RepID=UPI0022E381E1|nr:hypothetical protein [Paenibacillus macerans]
MKQSVLLFGHENDPHVLAVRAGLLERGVKVQIFDIYNKSHKIALIMEQDKLHGELIINDNSLQFNEISKIWWRIKPHPYIGDNIENKAIREFIQTEWRSMLNGLYHHIPNAIWINHPGLQHKANFKTNQLLLAKRVGFQIPNTIFSNDYQSIITQLSDFDRIIYKQIGWNMFPNGDVIFTNEVKKSLLEQMKDNISLSPGIYQELLDKEYELRITVVGADIYAVKINSQEFDSTIIDWRHDQLVSMYEPYQLTNTFCDMLREYMRVSELKYGAFDFVKTKRGYIFIECNPSGQWLWIEDRVSTYKVTESLVNLLN